MTGAYIEGYKARIQKNDMQDKRYPWRVSRGDPYFHGHNRNGNGDACFNGDGVKKSDRQVIKKIYRRYERSQ